jgi:hypothetical protein
VSEAVVMHEITAIRTRVETASGLSEALAAGWGAFELLLAVLPQCEERRDEWFAAFAFASAAAAEGRDILASAPSFARDPGPLISVPVRGGADLGHIADELARLGQALSAQLSAAAFSVGDASDQAACRDAAHEAAQVHHLLARGD